MARRGAQLGRLRRVAAGPVLVALTAGCVEVGPPVGSGRRTPDPPPQVPPGADVPPQHGVPPQARSPQPPSPRRSEPDDLAEAVHDRINAYRESRGLEPLDLDDDVSRLAEEHSRRMAAGQVPLGHSGFEDRASTIRAEHDVRRLAENVGYNRAVADPAADAVARWLSSPAHQENVVGDYESTGIGVVRSARGAYYFTQIFVEPAD